MERRDGRGVGGAVEGARVLLKSVGKGRAVGKPAGFGAWTYSVTSKLRIFLSVKGEVPHWIITGGRVADENRCEAYTNLPLIGAPLTKSWTSRGLAIQDHVYIPVNEPYPDKVIGNFPGCGSDLR